LGNRLGGTNFLDISTGSSGRVLNLSGGSLNIIGGASPVAEQLATLTVTNGGGIITLSSTSTSLSLGTLTALGTGGGTALFRGPGLNGSGGTAGTVSATTPNLIGAGGAAGSTTMSIRPDILGDVSTTGMGTGFVTHVSGTGFRLLTAAEMATANSNTYFGNSLPVVLSGQTANNIGLNTNVSLNQMKQVFDNTLVNSLVLTTGGGAVLTGGVGSVASPAGTLFGPNGQMTAITVASGGILGLGGNLGLAGGQINRDNNLGWWCQHFLFSGWHSCERAGNSGRGYGGYHCQCHDIYHFLGCYGYEHQRSAYSAAVQHRFDQDGPRHCYSDEGKPHECSHDGEQRTPRPGRRKQHSPCASDLRQRWCL